MKQMVAFTDQIQDGMPQRVSKRIYFSVIAKLTHAHGWTYRQQRYLSVTFERKNHEINLRLLPLPGTQWMEVPVVNAEWEMINRVEYD